MRNSDEVKPVLSATSDVREADDQYPQRLTADGDERPRNVRQVIDTDIAAGNSRPVAKRTSRLFLARAVLAERLQQNCLL